MTRRKGRIGKSTSTMPTTTRRGVSQVDRWNKSYCIYVRTPLEGPTLRLVAMVFPTAVEARQFIDEVIADRKYKWGKPDRFNARLIVGDTEIKTTVNHMEELMEMDVSDEDALSEHHLAQARFMRTGEHPKVGGQEVIEKMRKEQVTRAPSTEPRAKRAPRDSDALTPGDLATEFKTDGSKIRNILRKAGEEKPYAWSGPAAERIRALIKKGLK